MSEKELDTLTRVMDQVERVYEIDADSDVLLTIEKYVEALSDPEYEMASGEWSGGERRLLTDLQELFGTQKAKKRGTSAMEINRVLALLDAS